MKEKQYLKLSLDVTNVVAALNLHNSRITEFASKCAIVCKDARETLDGISTSTQGNPSLGTVQQLKINLETLKANLKKEIELPTIEYKKSIDKIEHDVEKTNNNIKMQHDPTPYDLKPLLKSLEQAKSTLSALNQKLDLCFSDIVSYQAKIAYIDGCLQLLDLPNTIERTTKHIEKMSAELGGLQQQIASSPDKKTYQAAFLPLSTALAKLRIQSQDLSQVAAITDSVEVAGGQNPKLNL